MRKKQRNIGKRILTWLLALGLLLGGILIPETVAYADNLIIALSASTVKIGDSLTVTITLPAGVVGTVNLTYSQDVFQYSSASATANTNAGTVSMSLGSYDDGNTRASGTVTFKATAAGTGSFAVSAPNANNQEGDRASVGDASAKVTVENDSNEDNANKSADNSLSSLSLSEGTLSPAFSYNVTSYTAEVANDVTSVSVSAKASNAAATVESVTGGENLSVGTNTIEVVVKAENGVKATYTITVTRKAAASDEAEPVEEAPAAVEDVTESEPAVPATEEEIQPETKDDSTLAMQALNAQISDLESQNRLLLWAFAIVVLILLAVIVVLLIKQRGLVAAAEGSGSLTGPEPAEIPEEESTEEEPVEESAEEELIEEPAEESITPEEDETAVEDVLAEAIIAQAQAATGVLRLDTEPEPEEKPGEPAEEEPDQEPEPGKTESTPEPDDDDDDGDIEFIDL